MENFRAGFDFEISNAIVIAMEKVSRIDRGLMENGPVDTLQGGLPGAPVSHEKLRYRNCCPEISETRMAFEPLSAGVLICPGVLFRLYYNPAGPVNPF